MQAEQKNDKSISSKDSSPSYKRNQVSHLKYASTHVQSDYLF